MIVIKNKLRIGVFKGSVLLILLGGFISIEGSFGQCVGNLVWSDEFNGTSLDLTKWSYETGNGCPSLCGWGNGELEYYTSNPANIRVTGGELVIEVLPENISGSTFSSGKIISRNKAYWTYGRFEARLRLPEGRGLWPAFWMLPETNAWPTTGEIDIMEYRGDHTNITSATLHYGNTWPNNQWDGTDYTHTSSLAATYNIYAVEWDATEIRWYFNDRLFKIVTRTPNTLNPPNLNANVWPWTNNFHFLINLAVGGWFTGTTNTNDIVLTKSTYEIDYVRVYDMTPVIGSQWPYNGTPSVIPGRIQAEEYDRTCNQAAYFDTDLPNQGGDFRGERVDIQTTTDATGAYNVGWTAAGEWLEYTVNVTTNATYDFLFRISSDGGGGRLHIEMDGTDVTGAVNLPNTFDWNNWQNYTVNNIALTPGNHIMRLYVENAGFNINYFDVSLNTVLPVTFLAFEANNSEGVTMLNWSTGYEFHNDYFTIERSLDGIVWNPVGTVISQGDAENSQQYKWIEVESVVKSVYYRIKQTDKDGKASYSKMDKIMTEKMFEVLPNPFADNTIIYATEPIGRFEIFDITGSLVNRYNVDALQYELGSELKKGIYLGKFENGGVIKLIKK